MLSGDLPLNDGGLSQSWRSFVRIVIAAEFE